MKKILLLALVMLLALSANIISPQSFATADYNANAKALLNEYYNDGEYTKDSQIFYVGEAGGKYDTSFFHAGVDNLIRKTEYSNGKLYMSNSEETINSGYKDVDGGMAHYYKSGADEVVDYTVDGQTVENFYTTLYDLKDVDGWLKSGTKYSIALNEDTCTPWVNFIAPLWISNHIKINKVVLYESNGLVLELYGKANNSVETDSLFARATIHYTKTVIQSFNDSALAGTDGFFNWNGKIYPTNALTIEGYNYTGALLLNETQSITFNATKGGILKITCIGLNGNQPELRIGAQETKTISDGKTIKVTVEQSGLISITTDSKIYIYEIAYVIEK